jgi:O-antigen/teichoic acid export membrane protein
MNPPRDAGVLALLRGRSGLAAVVQTGIATVLVLGINVVTGIISARLLGAQGRGELSALLLAPQFLGFLFTFGLPAATIVKIRSAPEDAAGIMGASLLLSALAGVLAATSGILALPLVMHQYSAQVVTEARWLVLLVTTGVTGTVLMAGLQVQDHFRGYNHLRFWQSAVTLAALCVLALTHAFTPVTGALAYLLPAVPFFAWNLYWVWREFRPRLGGWRGYSRTLLSYGWRVHFMDIGNTMFGQLDKLILVSLLAPAVFGVYVVVFNLSRLITTFANSAIPVLLPRSAGKSADEVLALTSRALTATLALTLAAVAGFVVFGGLGLRWLYGAPFAAGYPVLVILAAEAALAGAATVLQQPYIALHRPGTVALFHALSLAVAAVLVYALARAFGAEGAACGLLLATALRCILTYHGFHWLLRIGAPRLLPTRAELAGLLNRLRTSLA